MHILNILREVLLNTESKNIKEKKKINKKGTKLSQFSGKVIELFTYQPKRLYNKLL